MSSKIQIPSLTLDLGWPRFLLPLFVALLCSNAWGACPGKPSEGTYQNISINKSDCSDNPSAPTYSKPTGTVINETIEVCPPPATTTNVSWSLGKVGTCTGTSPDITCNGINIKAPEGLSVLLTEKVTIKGTLTSSPAIFKVTVADAPSGTPACTRTYTFSINASGGGWGDPHIITVEGVKYDFQSAGEFTALRGDGLEIQTRQTPVATSSPPGFTNKHTGLTSCVSIYTAVAAHRAGTCKVSYQPDLIHDIQDPDPKKSTKPKLRVGNTEIPFIPETGIEIPPEIDGKCTIKLPAHGTKTSNGDRIVKSSTGDGFEIHYGDRTKLVVTPAYWGDDQKKWYLNVDVYNTTASEGIMGKLAEGSWLPALPGDVSLGAKPDKDPSNPYKDYLHERYIALYDQFANAWRVTDTTSLFYYEKGTSTATFNQPSDWPRENPTSCAIEGESSARPVDINVAEQHCKGIVDPNIKANCIFDVSVTGFSGFADTYKLTEKLQKANVATGWGGGTVDNRPPEEKPPTTDVDIGYYWLILLLIIFIILFFILKNK
ncbi:MAG: hypothetical protein WCH01_00485 [Methylococcaceae bacterium]